MLWFIKAKAVPKTHATTHQDAGSDEISVTGLSGLLADIQKPKTDAVSIDLDASNQARILPALKSDYDDAVTKKHTQNTDKIIKDADADTSIDTEESADVDTIVVKAAGATVLKILANGNVGIGTPTPGMKLDVAGGDVRFSHAGLTTYYSDTVDNLGYIGQGNQIVTGSAAKDFAISTGIAAANMVFGINNAEKVRIDTSGNVGIGTTSPKSVLHVVGLPIYANNAAAVAGGLTAGAFYRTNGNPDLVCVVH